MEIDTNLLESDIKKLIKYMNHGMSDHKTFENISSFNSLNFLYASLTGKSFSQDFVLPPDNNFDYRIQKYNYRAVNSYLSNVEKNIDFFLKIISNYNDMLDAEDYYYFDSYGKMNIYSEKDFKDILLDFFSKCGELQFKIVKKYFDEKRIELGTNIMGEDEDMYSGEFISSIYLKSGYIVTTDDLITSKLITTVAHEFGHALDYELFIFPQQKKMNFYGDFFLEISSGFFELLFIDYLKKNRMDGVVPDILLNDRIAILGEGQENLEIFKFADYFDVTNEGNIITEDDKILHLQDSILYGLGYYYAFHLMYLYNNMSRDEFWKLYYDLLCCRKETPAEKIIDMLGISYDDFISGKYIQPAIKSNIRTLKKRYNME